MTTGLDQHGALRERFATANTFVIPDLQSDLSLSSIDQTGQNLRDLAEEGSKRGVQIQIGMGDVEHLSAALRGANSAIASRINQRKLDEKRKKSLEEAQLREILDALVDDINKLGDDIDEMDKRIDRVETIMEQLQNGSIDADEAMNDPETSDAIRAWEQRTGQKFDKDAENSSDVLFVILSEHRDGLLTERNALNQRRNDRIEEHNNAAGHANQFSAGQMREARIFAEGGTQDANAVALDAKEEEYAVTGAVVYDEHDATKRETSIDDVAAEDSLASLSLSDISIDISETTLDAQIQTASIGLEGGLEGIEGVGVAHFTASAAPPPEVNEQDFEVELAANIELGRATI